jgi:hypothetical protein
VHALKLSLREESLVLGDNFLRLISRVKAMSVPENVAGVAAAVPSARSLRDPWISHPGNSGELLVV